MASCPSSCLIYRVAASSALVAAVERYQESPGDLLFSCFDNAAALIFENYLIRRTARNRDGYTVKIIVYDSFLFQCPNYRSVMATELVRKTLRILNEECNSQGAMLGRGADLSVTVSEYFRVSS